MANDNNGSGQLSKEELDQARLQLEREKFEFEKAKTRKDEASFSRRLGISLALAGTFISLVTGAIQFYVNNRRAAQERDMAIGKVLLEQGPKIYSENETERAYVIEVIRYTSSNKELSDKILGRFLAHTKDDAIKQQLRAAQGEVPKPLATASKPTLVSLPQDIAFDVSYTEKGNGLYNFVIKIRASTASMALIKSAKYKIEHPSFRNKNFDGDPKDSYAMNYTGWGAVDDVKATVLLTNGETMNASINMIEQLRW